MRFRPVGPKSRRVLRLSTASIEAYEGAVRSSKTITSLIDFGRFVRKAPAGELAIVGRTERTVARNLIEPMVAMFGKRHVAYNRGTSTLTLFGRIVYVIGANNEAARTKIQGMTLVGLYIDEVAVIPESFFNMAYTRLSVDGAKMWVTANPEGRNHWFLTNWLEKGRLWLQGDGTLVRTPDGPIDLHRYTYTIDDNPFLTAAFVRRLKNSYTGVWYLRYILSQWTNAEGAIYDQWDPKLHQITNLPDDVVILRRVVGVDYGTTNAFAAVLVGLGSNRKLYVLDEWRHDSRAGEARWTDAELSLGFRRWLAKHESVDWIAIDPSAASFKTQLERDQVKRVMSADNAVRTGLRNAASLLAIGSLLVLARCDKLIGEIPGYCWDPKAVARGEDAPIKINDHSCDAMRYAVMAALAYWGRNIDRELLPEEVAA